MTTKGEIIWISRVSSKILLVDDIMVSNQDGLWTTQGNVTLGDDRIKAIFNFLNAESNMNDLTATKLVRDMLNERNIVYEI